MKHAYITAKDETNSEKTFEIKLNDENSVFLGECEYTEEEMEQFRKEADKWIVGYSGTQQFTADSDSGEDARGYFGNYFDLVPERAVFEDGKLVGFYLCSYGIKYAGRGRYNFEIEDWGYPGDNVFNFVSWGAETHLFLFEDKTTHSWKRWKLQVRDPQAKYESYLDF